MNTQSNPSTSRPNASRFVPFLVLFAAAVVSVSSLAVSSADAQPLRRDPTRLRWAIEGGGGGDWGTPRGPSVGLLGQIGGQFNDTFALFYQPSIIVHALSTSTDADRFVAFGNLAMGDVTFGVLQLGLGGGFDIGHFAACDNDVCTRGSRLIQPAIGGRIAAVIPLHAYRGRFGIPIAFQVHSTFLDNSQNLTALMLTIGVERF